MSYKIFLHRRSMVSNASRIGIGLTTKIRSVIKPINNTLALTGTKADMWDYKSVI